MPNELQIRKLDLLVPHWGMITSLRQLGRHSCAGEILECSTRPGVTGRKFNFDPANIVVDLQQTDSIEELKKRGITVGTEVQFKLVSTGIKGEMEVAGFIYPIYFNPGPIE
jgi:hypothetical protein